MLAVFVHKPVWPTTKIICLPTSMLFLSTSTNKQKPPYKYLAKTVLKLQK